MDYDKRGIASSLNMQEITDAIRNMGVRDLSILKGGVPPMQPKPPTDLEKAIKEAPMHPSSWLLFPSIEPEHLPALMEKAAREHFTYMLMIGADVEKLKQDPYWKYYEQD